MSELFSFRERLLNSSFISFDDFALEIFQWQAFHNPVYRYYISLLKIDPGKVQKLEEIPFLPIEFFKTHFIKTGEWSHSLVFTSSGTTGGGTSSHYVDDPSFYQKLSRKIFEAEYGPLSHCHIIALLPSYLERAGSSLVYMVDDFIQQTGSPFSGFFLSNDQQFLHNIEKMRSASGKKLLLGVTFALLQLAEKQEVDLSDFIVMETGGMKGRGKELTRGEVHESLTAGLGVKSVHSEYGMTELMSQAYANASSGVFRPHFSIKVLIREINDPFCYHFVKKTGGLNIIDLGNLHSCCFVETKDIGRILDENGSFEVLGRMDNSDVRGCNLLI